MTILLIACWMAGAGAFEAFLAGIFNKRLGDLWHVARVLWATAFTYFFVVGCIVTAVQG